MKMPITIDLPPSAMSPPHREDDRWAVKIRSAWQKSVESILETGRLLTEAKAALPHGGFEIMVRDQLPFAARTAQRLMAIAANRVLSNTTHASLLPASWNTLYHLSRLDEGELKAGLSRRLIKPELQRKDLPGILQKIRKGLGKRIVTKTRKTESRVSLFVLCRRRTTREQLAYLDGLDAAKTQKLVDRFLKMVDEDRLTALPVTTPPSDTTPDRRATPTTSHEGMTKCDFQNSFPANI